MSVRLLPGEHIRFDGIVWAVERRVSTGYQIVGVGDGFPRVVTDDELIQAWTAGRMQMRIIADAASPAEKWNPPDTSFAARPETDRKAAIFRAKILSKVRADLGLPPYSNAALASFITDTQKTTEWHDFPSLRSLRRYMALEQAAVGSIDGLVPKHGGPSGSQLSIEAEGIMETILHEFVLQQVPAPIREIYSTLVVRIQAENLIRGTDPLPCPSQATFYRRAALLDDMERISSQKGRAAARRAYGSVARAPAETEPMAVVEIDHGWFDCMVVDDDGVVLGRPTLTIAIDRATRMVVGFVLCWEPPSFASVMMVVRHMIRAKDYVADRYAGVVRNVWPSLGLPRTIVVDNGPEFHSNDLMVACQQVGRISIDYAETGRPQLKGTVERYFRTMNQQLIHLLPGTTFSRFNRESDYDPARAARVTLAKMHEFLHIYFVDVYNQGWHRGLKNTPVAAWEEGVKRNPPRLPNKVEDLDALTSGHKVRTVGARGIELFGLFYQSPELSGIRIAAKGNPSIVVRSDPTDLGTVFVHHPTEPRLIRAGCTNPHVYGRTKWQHERVMEALAGKARNATGNDYHEARARLRKSIEEGVKTRKGRKTATKRDARFLNSPTQPGAAPPMLALPEYASNAEAFAPVTDAGGVREKAAVQSPATLVAEPADCGDVPKQKGKRQKRHGLVIEQTTNLVNGNDEIDGSADADDLDAEMARLGVTVKRSL